MKINDQDKNTLLKRFPNIKLSYEKIHKKVLSDLYYIIPKGKKHLVWFTYINDNKVCIFIELYPGCKINIHKLYIVPQIFNKSIVLGTILYGTLFHVNEKKIFSIENIHYYKGKNIEEQNELFKLTTIKNMLSSEIKQIILGKNGIYFGLPLVTSNFEKSISIAKDLPYNVYSIQHRNLNNNTNLLNYTLYKNYNDIYKPIKYIFLVSADIQNDIYNLYVKNNKNDIEKYDIAYIPDYKTSVMMNKIFRYIKENYNLDALEESDDEEEFQNISYDKFVDLEKSVKMECVYNKKFNKFVPIKVSYNENIVQKHLINYNI